jgi:S-adenosyl-L-methionine hydrolase (adenosine-forming)
MLEITFVMIMSCITLLSDFGLQDASVASAKGILMQYTPNLPVVDISHMVEPFQLQQAAYLLSAAYNTFPKGSIHLLLFDVFSEKEPTLILCEQNGHFFLSPDNGLLALAFDPELENVWNVFQLTGDLTYKDWLTRSAQIISQLQNQTPNQLGLPTYQLKNAPLHWRPKVEENTVECNVIHIDRFENVVINLQRELFEKVGRGRPFRIQFMRDEFISELSNRYSSVKDGEKLCRFNSAGYLEIAINRGKAASLFGLQLYNDQHVIYSRIKVFFE